MSRVLTALVAASILGGVATVCPPAGCYSCEAPPQPVCGTCYQPQQVAPQYRTVEETVMVAPGRTIAHRTPAQYRTVMVPRTVIVAPQRACEYEQRPGAVRHGSSAPRWFRAGYRPTTRSGRVRVAAAAATEIC